MSLLDKPPKPYIIMVYFGEYEGWKIRAEYETKEVAEMHALDILKTEHPRDLMIVKKLELKLEVSDV